MLYFHAKSRLKGENITIENPNSSREMQRLRRNNGNRQNESVCERRKLYSSIKVTQKTRTMMLPPPDGDAKFISLQFEKNLLDSGHGESKKFVKSIST